MKPPSYLVTTAGSASRDFTISSKSETQKNPRAHASLDSLKGSFISRLSPKIYSLPIRPSSSTGEGNIASSSLSSTTPEATSILAPSHSSVHLPIFPSVEGGRPVISTFSTVVTRALAILPSTPANAKLTTHANTIKGTTLHHSPVTVGPDGSPPIGKSDQISKAVDGILPILVGSDNESTANAPMETKQKQKPKQRAALANFVGWLLSFHIEMD